MILVPGPIHKNWEFDLHLLPPIGVDASSFAKDSQSQQRHQNSVLRR